MNEWKKRKKKKLTNYSDHEQNTIRYFSSWWSIYFVVPWVEKLYYEMLARESS